MDAMASATVTVTSMAMETSMSMTGMAAASTSMTNGSMLGCHHKHMGGSTACKISMLWNWNTVDACFISSTWHITSNGMFAGSCIGVILLVITHEFVRRLQREYDRHALYQRQNQQMAMPEVDSRETDGTNRDRDGFNNSDSKVLRETTTPLLERAWGGIQTRQQRIRPHLSQQLIRAAIHTLQFGLAYFIMLLAMYYNGYIIICIIIGAFIGFFMFSWDGIAISESTKAPEACG